MKNKFWVILLYILLGIPVPFSLVSVFGSIISLASIETASSVALAMISVLAMVLAGTYTATYVVSLVLTAVKKKIRFYTFLPMIHLAVAGLFFLLWRLCYI